jgi:hypothetical protein
MELAIGGKKYFDPGFSRIYRDEDRREFVSNNNSIYLFPEDVVFDFSFHRSPKLYFKR